GSCRSLHAPLVSSCPQYDSCRTSELLCCGGRNSFRANRVTHLPIRTFRALQFKTRFVLWPVHQEAQHGCLPAFLAVITVEFYVLIGESPPACSDFRHRHFRITPIEHGHSPHLPITVAGMGIVGMLDRYGPAIRHAITNLGDNFVVPEVGQIRKGTLSDSHQILSSLTASA